MNSDQEERGEDEEREKMMNKERLFLFFLFFTRTVFVVSGPASLLPSPAPSLAFPAPNVCDSRYAGSAAAPFPLWRGQGKSGRGQRGDCAELALALWRKVGSWGVFTRVQARFGPNARSHLFKFRNLNNLKMRLVNLHQLVLLLLHLPRDCTGPPASLASPPPGATHQDGRVRGSESDRGVLQNHPPFTPRLHNGQQTGHPPSLRHGHYSPTLLCRVVFFFLLLFIWWLASS